MYVGIHMTYTVLSGSCVHSWDLLYHIYDHVLMYMQVVDEGDFLELQPTYAPNIIIAFGEHERTFHAYF